MIIDHKYIGKKVIILTYDRYAREKGEKGIYFGKVTKIEKGTVKLKNAFFFVKQFTNWKEYTTITIDSRRVLSIIET
jgi:hypothetical protein